MPPKRRYSKEAIINTAFNALRDEGAESVNVRNIAAKSGCSTQPIMYYFDSIEQLKREVYLKADDFHTDYITNISGESKDMLKNIALRYIRFAVEERELFRFLFHSEYSAENPLMDSVSADDNEIAAELLQPLFNISKENSIILFRQLFMFVHGYACFLSDHRSSFDESRVRKDIESAVKGFICSFK